MRLANAAVVCGLAAPPDDYTTSDDVERAVRDAPDMVTAMFARVMEKLCLPYVQPERVQTLANFRLSLGGVHTRSLLGPTVWGWVAADRYARQFLWKTGVLENTANYALGAAIPTPWLSSAGRVRRTLLRDQL